MRRRSTHRVIHNTVGNLHVLHNVCSPFHFQISYLHFASTQGVIHSILCQRLLLRLRGAYESLTEGGRQAMRLQGATTLSTEDTFPMSVLGRASEK